ncbi:MAG TPA: nucleoside triphosphate pyrophosphohydrolase [Myxococcales bacterium]|nr:nucleoside triphosphate pyrophosphohydrolase [Deltaproteobacteria bacterium]HAA56786.1 nucleoside triphosphate pyrophosphohydrolase [Myxococcales bacterium]|tara:strand:- start:10400 stop:11332 length:933 start_codon:yes stop_codon:yes gene_type:complete
MSQTNTQEAPLKETFKRWLHPIQMKLPIVLPFFSPTALRAGYRAAQLTQIVATLRSPQGCPWDRKQTLRTILPDLREEVLEAVEAGQKALDGEYDDFQEELGDVLFLVTFLSRFCEEDGHFSLADAYTDIVEKMIRRHPHVFEDPSIKEEDIKRNWAKIKAQEKASSQPTFRSIFEGIPALLPALHLAQKISAKAIQVGFDWPDEQAVLRKVDEELQELREAIAHESHERQEAELGDLLFTIVNLARHLKIDAENALASTSHRFRKRFQQVEQLVFADQKDLHETPQHELEHYWQRAKELEKHASNTPSS